LLSTTFGRRYFLVLIAALAFARSAVAAISFTGVNLAGADFGEGNLPGVYNTHYTYPTAAEVDYYVGKGMNTFRLPFRWERLQQSQNAAFNAAELARMNAFVNYATGKGANVVLDPHNYARYFGNVVGTAALPNAAFGDFWSRLAGQFKDNDRVIFGLMNEPHSMPTEQWLSAANSAIAAIRQTGADNLVLVPGNAWTGAHSWTQNWYGTPNATVMLGVVDPGNNYAYDVHQYLDNDSSGGSSTIVSPTIGRERLVQFTNWLKSNNRRGFLGEFAAANSQIGTGATQIGDEAIDNMLDYIEANDDVWLGWTWWAGGPWWGNYLFSLEPTNLGQPSQADRPAMDVLAEHLVSVDPFVPGDYNVDGTVDAADYAVWRDLLGSGTALPNDDTAGVALDDYQRWKSNFGLTTGAASSTPVPEPSSAMLLLLAAALVRRRVI
jgi:endoglucanase